MLQWWAITEKYAHVAKVTERVYKCKEVETLLFLQNIFAKRGKYMKDYL